MSNGLISTYINSIANFLSNGAFINKSGLSALGIRPLYDRIITKSSVKKVVSIVRFDINLDKNFTSLITRYVSDHHPGCSVIFSFSNFKSDLHKSVRTKEFKRSMDVAYQRFSSYEQMFEGLTDSEQTVGKKVYLPGGKMTVTREQLEGLSNLYHSYKYSYETISNDGTMFSSYCFVELVAPDNSTLNKLMESFDMLMIKLKCSYVEIKKSNNHYLSSMSPTGYYYQSEKGGLFYPNLLSDENLAFLMPYQSNGFLGDGTGTLLGLNMGSRSPFILNFYKTSDRQIICYLVPSGEGKTLSSQMTCLFMIHQGYHSSVIDVKGGEWIKLNKWVNAKEIDISSINGSYVNTLRLDDVVDLIGDNKEDARMFFSSATDSSIEAIRIMSSYTEDSEDFADASSIIKYAVSRYYTTYEVNPSNPKTFINTAKMDYYDLIDFIGKLKSVDLYSSKHALIDNIQARCLSFLDTSRLLEGNEITIRDILDSELVIYSLNKNRDAVGDPTMESLRTFMITYLDMKKIYIRKAKGLATVCFYEEVQRKEEFAKLLKFINAVVTGARSSNVTVFLLCNTPSVLLDKDVSGVRSNISTYIIGKLTSEDDIGVLQKLGIGDVIPSVREMTNNPQKFKNCFVCKYDTGYDANTVYFRAMVPPSVLKYLNTRDRQDDEPSQGRLNLGFKRKK